jgi:uracil-DNA glycosylase family 4
MVVGVQPGNTEKTSGEAFSGNAGTRLMQWLANAGLGENRQQIFENVYFTSVLKCATEDRFIGRCAEHCFPWLEQQIEIVRPRCVISLGKVPLQLLFNCTLSLDDVVGRLFREEELTMRMFPVLPQRCIVVPLPHPSGMSRWPNLPANRLKIDRATALLASKVSV